MLFSLWFNFSKFLEDLNCLSVRHADKFGWLCYCCFIKGVLEHGKGKGSKYTKIKLKHPKRVAKKTYFDLNRLNFTRAFTWEMYVSIGFNQGE